MKKNTLTSLDSETLELFAVAAPGLEAVVASELSGLGIRAESAESAETEIGGIEFRGDTAALYMANLQLRTASRVLVRLGSFTASAFSELRKKASKLEWGRFLSSTSAVSIRVTCRKSKLYHSQAVAERVYGAINDALGAQVVPAKLAGEDDNSPPQLVVVRIENNMCAISIDSSGELLHRRGYRQALGKAPLRETLAAAMVLSSGWDRKSPLIDPFCGSGVIPIEAAMIAANIPPGLHRNFAFMQWPSFDRVLWSTILQEATPSDSRAKALALGFDRDAGVIPMARENATRAGVVESVEFGCQALSHLKSPGVPGWLVFNPPYGVRVSSNKDLRNLYAQIGHVFRAGFGSWRFGILSPDQQLFRQTGLNGKGSLSFANGGLKVRLVTGTI